MSISGEREYLIQLRKLLVTRLNDSDLRDLCFDLGIDYENLPGHGKADKARELILYIEKREKIPDLVAVCKQLRPDVQWEQQAVSGENHDQIPLNHLSPEARFWKWFRRNSDRLLNLGDIKGPEDYDKVSRDPVLAELSDELRKVAHGLTYEISSKESFGRELIISADGRRELFSPVIKLVGSAPVIDGWKIVAFRQPWSTEITLMVGDNTLEVDELWFHAIPNLDKLDLIIFVDNLSAREEEFVKMASFIILDAILGEYDVVTSISGIEWYEAPNNPREARLKSFRELPGIVKSWKTLMDY